MAEFEFTFTVATNLIELVVLDVDEVPRSHIVTDHTGRQSAYAGYGENGKMVITFNDAQVRAGGTLKVRCPESCGVEHILCLRRIGASPQCLPKTVDFNLYATGARVSSGEDWILSKSAYARYGDNGKLTIPLNDAQVPAGGTLKVRCTGSCSIADILRSRCISETPHCLPKTVDFNAYATGARVSSGEDRTLSAIRLGAGATGDASAVFNTSMPTGGDTDLGAPNALCPVPGPGVGRGGRPESRGGSCDPLGQVLIAHTGDLASLRSACAGCSRGIRCAGYELNDHAGGASFRFTFGRALRLGRLMIMDLDDAARSGNIEMSSEKIFMTGLGITRCRPWGLGCGQWRQDRA